MSTVLMGTLFISIRSASKPLFPSWIRFCRNPAFQLLALSNGGACEYILAADNGGHVHVEKSGQMLFHAFGQIVGAPGVLQNIPEELYEAARVDGTNAVRIFFKITLPYMLYVTTPYLITGFTGNVNDLTPFYQFSPKGEEPAQDSRFTFAWKSGQMSCVSASDLTLYCLSDGCGEIFAFACHYIGLEQVTWRT